MTKDQELRDQIARIIADRAWWDRSKTEERVRLVRAIGRSTLTEAEIQAATDEAFEYWDSDRKDALAKSDTILALFSALLSRAEQAEARATQAEAALAQIGRMSLFPDDKINCTTLQAAIHIARKGSALSTNGGGREGFIAARELPPSDAGRDGIEGKRP